MTKQRHCYVADVGVAIEKLADALDPERTKPFGGDILDLLEWAAKDVLAMRSENEKVQAERDTFYMDYRIKCDEQTKSLHVEVEFLRQQLSDMTEDRDDCLILAKMNFTKSEDNKSLRQQLAAKQAEVDALMLEYCPSEMSQEQLDGWAAHQQPIKEYRGVHVAKEQLK